MKKFAIVALASCLVFGGCAQFAAGVTNIAASAAGPAPGQVTTLSRAEQAATVITDAVHTLVDVHKFDREQLIIVSALNDALHSALTDLEKANAAGQSLNFAAFNAAMDAYNVYMTAHPA